MNHQPVDDGNDASWKEAEYLIDRFCEMERVGKIRKTRRVVAFDGPSRDRSHTETKLLRKKCDSSTRALDLDDNMSVQVAVRVRPLSDNEYGDECIHLISHTDDEEDILSESEMSSSARYQTIQVGEGESSPKFTFDHVLPPQTDQIELYFTCVKPLIHSCLEGYNTTIFAYGQTGAGKTHTIMGDIDIGNGVGELAGVIPRALRGIFNGLKDKGESYKPQDPPPGSKSISAKQPFEYHIKVQFLEIYGDEIIDLVQQDDMTSSSNLNEFDLDYPLPISASSVDLMLNGKKRKRLAIRDGKPGEDAEVIGAIQAKVESAEEALDYLQRGMERRRTEKTAMNAVSSRSHAIFTLLIQQTQRNVSNMQAVQKPGKELVEMKTSKIHFVDLAGSERIKSAKTEGKRLKEGININKGLFVLGNVISALGNEVKLNKTHVPYRDSKLTRLLKGSLGGNHKTLMIACISPANVNREESTNTLRYANRAKSIQNHAKINIDPASRVVNELRGQVAALAQELLRLRANTDFDYDESCPFPEEFLEKLIRATANAILPSRPVTAPSKQTKNLLPESQPSAPSSKTKLPIRKLIARPGTAPLPTKLSHHTEKPKQFRRRSHSFEEKRSSNNLEDIVKDVGKFSIDDDQDDEQIALYDRMCSTLRETLVKTRSKNSFLSESATFSSTDEYSEYSSSPTGTSTCSSDVETTDFTFHQEYAGSANDNGNLIKFISECKVGYETLKLENELKLVETKITNCKKERKYFEGIIGQFDERSFYFKEMTKAIRNLEGDITNLKKERGNLLELSNRTKSNIFNTPKQHSMFTAFDFESRPYQSFSHARNTHNKSESINSGSTYESRDVLSRVDEESVLSVEMVKSVNTIEEEIAKLETVRSNILSLSSMKKPSIATGRKFYPDKLDSKSELHSFEILDNSILDRKKFGVKSELIIMEDSTVASNLSAGESDSFSNQNSNENLSTNSSKVSRTSGSKAGNDPDSGRALRSVVLRYSSPLIKPFVPFLGKKSTRSKTRR